jgi:hypothetical protein
MKNLLPLLVLGLVSLPSAHALQAPYYGKGAVEGWVDFDYSVRFRSQATPTEKQVRDKVEQQLFYVLYPLERASDAIPYREFALSDVQLEAGANGMWEAKYHFRGKFAGTSQKKYPLYMPFQPDALQSLIIKNGANLCGGGTSARTLWLEWDPTRSDCPLKDGVDYKKLVVDLQVVPNTQHTYPEYARLLDEVGNFSATIIYGDGTTSEFDGILAELQGYEVTPWTDEQKLAVAPGTNVAAVKVSTLSKQTATGLIRVILFQGDSHIGNDASRPFYYFYKKAIEQDAFVAYMGHAGYSHNLSLTEIEAMEGFQIKPKSGYQVYDIHACLPYFYYLDELFDRKATPLDPRGTKDLDVISAQVVGYFGYLGNVNMVRAVESFMNGQSAPTYQEMLKASDMYKTSVNGDEDNPTSL